MMDLEMEILKDIEDRVEIRSANLQLIDVSNKEIARKVLPVLREWVTRGIPASYRHSLYRLFMNKNAHDYLDSIVEWWAVEDYKLANEAITQSIHTVIRNDSDAIKALDAFQRKSKSDFDITFLTKMHKYKSVKKTVEDLLIREIQEGRYYKFDVKNIRKIKWTYYSIEDYIPAEKDAVGPLLRKKINKMKENEDIITAIKHGEILISEEIELDNFSESISEVLERYEFSYDKDILSSSFISILKSIGADEWIIIHLQKNGLPGDEEFFLQVRLEDFDLAFFQISKCCRRSCKTDPLS